MKTLKGLEVGDEVLIVPTFRDNAEPSGTGIVIKVARVWLTVRESRFHEEKYRRDTGFGAGDPSSWRITTAELWAEEKRRESLVATFRDRGITIMRSSDYKTSQLEDALAVLRGEPTAREERLERAIRSETSGALADGHLADWEVVDLRDRLEDVL